MKNLQNLSTWYFISNPKTRKIYMKNRLSREFGIMFERKPNNLLEGHLSLNNPGIYKTLGEYLEPLNLLNQAMGEIKKISSVKNPIQQYLRDGDIILSLNKQNIEKNLIKPSIKDEYEYLLDLITLPSLNKVLEDLESCNKLSKNKCFNYRIRKEFLPKIINHLVINYEMFSINPTLDLNYVEIIFNKFS